MHREKAMQYSLEHNTLGRVTFIDSGSFIPHSLHRNRCKENVFRSHRTNECPLAHWFEHVHHVLLWCSFTASFITVGLFFPVQKLLADVLNSKRATCTARKRYRTYWIIIYLAQWYSWQTAHFLIQQCMWRISLKARKTFTENGLNRRNCTNHWPLLTGFNIVLALALR